MVNSHTVLQMLYIPHFIHFSLTLASSFLVPNQHLVGAIQIHFWSVPPWLNPCVMQTVQPRWDTQPNTHTHPFEVWVDIRVLQTLLQWDISLLQKMLVSFVLTRSREKKMTEQKWGPRMKAFIKAFRNSFKSGETRPSSKDISPIPKLLLSGV